MDYRRDYLHTMFQGFQGKDFTPATVVKSINRAKRKVEKKLWLFDPLILLHLHADTVEYDFTDAGSSTSTNDVSKYCWSPLYVIVNKNRLLGADGRTWGFYGPQEFEHKFSDWFDTTTHPSGTPVAVVMYNVRKVLVWPRPTAAIVTAGNNYVSGFYLSADFTLTAPPGDADDMDQTLTDVPREIQEAVGIWSALQDAHPTIGETEQWRLFGSLSKDIADEIEEVGRANKSRVDGANSVFQPQVTQVEYIGDRWR